MYSRETDLSDEFFINYSHQVFQYQTRNDLNGV